MRRVVPIAAVLLVLVCAPADSRALETAPGNQAGQPGPLIIQPQDTRLLVGRNMRYLEDSESSLTIEQFLEPATRAGSLTATSDSINLGFSQSSYWFDMTLHSASPTARELLLEIDYPQLDSIDMFWVRDAQVLRADTMGDLQPFHARPINHRNFVVPFELEPGERVELILRVQTRGSVRMGVWVHDPVAFWAEETKVALIEGMFFGTMLIMTLYNAFVFLTTRSRAYFYYVLYVINFALAQLCIQGFDYQYLWPNSQTLHDHAILFAGGMTTVSCSLFTQSFLGLSRTLPSTGKAVSALASVSAFIALLSLALPYSVGIKLTALTVACGCFLLPVAGLLRVLQGSIEARYFLSAFISFALGGSFYILGIVGIFPSTFLSNYGVQLGACFEVLLLSLALGRRMKSLQDENTAIQRRAAATLQHKVDERTAELAAEKEISDRRREEAETARSESDRRRRDATLAEARAVQEQVLARSAHAEADRQKERAEEQREAAEAAHAKIAEMDRQKTQFFQNISHELRTPLTLVLNPLEDAAQDHAEDDRLQLAERNARRLLRLVNQLLDFQKLSAGKKTLQTEHIDLVRFAWVCGDYIRSTCAGRDVTFRVMLDREELSEADLGKSPRFIQGEVDALEKIVFNYLSNAMKFTPPGGEICLELDTQGEQLRLAVSDTGPGISADDQSKLFELFSQVDGSATRDTEGTGLGLALVKELAEAMHGHVGVESQPGKGARFWAMFPQAAAPAEDSAEASFDDFEVKPWLLADHAAQNHTEIDGADDEDVTGDGQRVLVVDDLADMRKLISEALKRNGYRTTTARDAFEGMHKAQESAPELIITDWMMPKKSGLDLIAEIRADEKLSHVPVVLLTARSDEEGKLLGTEVGADAFLGKPFNEQELCATVRNLLALKDHEKELAAAHQQLKEGVLKRYLPPALVDQIVANNGQLGLEHEARTITVLFADLCGFTPLSRRLPAPALARVLNGFLEQMVEVVFEHGGTIDKFIGDAVMVMFGAPEQMSTPEQARRATACALDMQKALQALNEDWKAQGIERLQIRIGLHTGNAVIGNFGSARRVDYTAIGDTVNTAARIESHGEPGQVLLSRTTAALLPTDVLEDAGEFELKGIEGKTRLYRVLPEAAGALKDGEVAA